MSGIYWLASYPKSGNTWLRLLLHSYFAGGSAVDINALSFGGWRGDERAQFDEAIGVAASDLTTTEISAWWPAALQARAFVEPAYLKTHDARLSRAAEGTLGAIYIVRDPRDVAVSLARHIDSSIDDAIAVMGTPDQMMNQSRRSLKAHLPEYWGSWSQNAESWAASAPFPVHIVTYEAMRADTEAAFAKVLAALRVPLQAEAVKAAVAASALDKMRSQEAAHGFIEFPTARSFFGEGRVQGWRDRLTPAQIARIEADHGPTMARFGYL